MTSFFLIFHKIKLVVIDVNVLDYTFNQNNFFCKVFMFSITIQLDMSAMLKPQVTTIICHDTK